MGTKHHAQPVALHSSLQGTFPNATADTIRSLRETARRVPFNRGDWLIRQGESMKALMLLAGYLALVRTSEDGRELILRIMRPGTFAGDQAVDGLCSPGGYRALAGGLASVWTGAVIRACSLGDRGFARDIAARNRLARSSLLRRVDALAFQGSRQRLASVLLEHADIAFDPVRPVLTRADLARLVGATPEMVDRIVGELERLGAIRRAPRRGLILRDRVLLEAVSSTPGPRRNGTAVVRSRTSVAGRGSVGA